MTIKEHSNIVKPEIFLGGSDGNAFVLLAHAKSYSKQLGLDWEVIRTKMTSSDYDNLIKVFDEHFGNYVDLITA